MGVNDIKREILIHAPIDVVWHIVTDPAQISTWWSDAADIDLQPGGQGTLTFTDHAANHHTVVGLQVETYAEPELFTFRWLHPLGSVPDDTNSVLVSFALTPDGDRTQLRVTEGEVTQLAWTDEQKATFYAEHNPGWDQHLSDLVTYAAQQAAPVARP